MGRRAGSPDRDGPGSTTGGPAPACQIRVGSTRSGPGPRDRILLGAAGRILLGVAGQRAGAGAGTRHRRAARVGRRHGAQAGRRGRTVAVAAGMHFGRCPGRGRAAATADALRLRSGGRSRDRCRVPGMGSLLCARTGVDRREVDHQSVPLTAGPTVGRRRSGRIRRGHPFRVVVRGRVRPAPPARPAQGSATTDDRAVGSIRPDLVHDPRAGRTRIRDATPRPRRPEAPRD